MAKQLSQIETNIGLKFSPSEETIIDDFLKTSPGQFTDLFEDFITDDFTEHMVDSVLSAFSTLTPQPTSPDHAALSKVLDIAYARAIENTARKNPSDELQKQAKGLANEFDVYANPDEQDRKIHKTHIEMAKFLDKHAAHTLSTPTNAFVSRALTLSQGQIDAVKPIVEAHYQAAAEIERSMHSGPPSPAGNTP